MFNINKFFEKRSIARTNLNEFAKLLEKLDNPQNAFRSIQVVGTNGKGSTCHFLSSILKENGFSVGLFTSPALIKVNERFLINGNEVDDADLIEAAKKVESVQGNLKLTAFDLMCATAFLLFKEKEVDYAVLETGLGGRLDPTNIVESELSIFTPISLDHTEILGNTVQAIAKEKSETIKLSQKKVIIGYQKKSVMNILKKKCHQVGVEYVALEDGIIALNYCDQYLQEFLFRYEDGPTYFLVTSMLGSHQQENACTALLAARELGCDAVAIREGIAKTKLKARMEIFEGSPDVIIDGAHNPNAIENLVKNIKEYFPNRKGILITSIMKEKDLQGIIKKVKPVIDYCFAVRFNERGYEEEEIIKAANDNKIDGEISRSFQNAFVKSLILSDERIEKDYFVLVTGSLYLAGAFRKFLLEDGE